MEQPPSAGQLKLLSARLTLFDKRLYNLEQQVSNLESLEQRISALEMARPMAPRPVAPMPVAPVPVARSSGKIVPGIVITSRQGQRWADILTKNWKSGKLSLITPKNDEQPSIEVVIVFVPGGRPDLTPYANRQYEKSHRVLVMFTVGTSIILLDREIEGMFDEFHSLNLNDVYDDLRSTTDNMQRFQAFVNSLSARLSSVKSCIGCGLVKQAKFKCKDCDGTFCQMECGKFHNC